MPSKPDTPCSICGKMLWSTATSLPAAERRCVDCRRVARQAECIHCGEGFESFPRSSGGRTKTCGKSCARKLELEEQRHPFWSDQTGKGRDPEKVQTNWRVRRARKHGATSEKYSLAEIAERDGSRCGLCRLTVDLDLGWPDPESASIDHVVPLSKGGDDTRANVQLAHLSCNLRKGVREKTAQLRLVG